MISIIVVAVVAISAVWVYLDATKNKVGKIPNTKGMFNMSAGAWGIVTLLLWIIGFPAYLIKRGDLIEKAKNNPVEVKGRGGKAAVFAIVGGLVVLGVVLSIGNDTLPTCDSAEVQSTVGQVVNDMPLVKSANAQFVSLKNIVEQGFNPDAQLRSCRATLVTTAGENDLQYTVKWGNKGKGTFFVQAQIQN